MHPDYLAALNKNGLDLAQSPVSAAQLGGMIARIKDGTISGKIAKQVFELLWNEGGNADAIIEKHGLKQVCRIRVLSKKLSMTSLRVIRNRWRTIALPRRTNAPKCWVFLSVKS